MPRGRPFAKRGEVDENGEPLYGGEQWAPGQSGNPAGKAPYQPTEEWSKAVSAMAAVGVPHTEIADVLEISVPTLQKYYGRELKTAKTRTKTRVAQALVATAIGDPNKGIAPNVAAQKFYLMTQGGEEWRPRIEVTSKEINQAVQIASMYLSGGALPDPSADGDEHED